MAPEELAASLNSLADKLRQINAQLGKAKVEIVARQPHPQALTDFRIPPHMRQRLRRIVGR